MTGTRGVINYITNNEIMGKDLEESSSVGSTNKRHVAETRVSFYAQSDDPIPKVTHARGSKDSRLFRPSSTAELLRLENYKPVTLNIFGYKVPIFCGQNTEDFVIIVLSYIALWSFILFFISMLLKGAIDSVYRHTALWIMFWLFVFSVIGLLFIVYTGQIERERRELKEKKELEDQAEARHEI